MNQHIISRLKAWKRECEARGDHHGADRMQESIDRWSGAKPARKPNAWNRLPFPAQFLIVAAAGLGLGVLIFVFLDYILLLILIIPGFVAFFAQALSNGSDMN